MNELDLQKLKTAQLEIMDEVHRLCTENGITYYIIGGTALGAVRHGGYIPWDVDIDIAMRREEYAHFAALCNELQSDRFAYYDINYSDKYYCRHARFSLKNTSLVIKHDDLNGVKKNIGIYIDIFPLDKAPNDENSQQKHASDIKRVIKLIELKEARRYKRDFKNMVVKKLVSKMIFWTNLKKLLFKFESICRKYENTDSKFLCSMSSHYSYAKQCMPVSVYGKPQLVKFEGREYYAPEMLDEYLKRIYGDYMRLPPEDERRANLEVFTQVVYDR